MTGRASSEAGDSQWQRSALGRVLMIASGAHVWMGATPVHIEVNGTRLWFDVDGPGLVPDGKQMRRRPTVVLVHGCPGVYDHSYFKPDTGR